MATVYLAHDLRHNRPVALKVLRPELTAVLGAERFLKEIEVTANLQHPHILPLFESGSVEAPSGAVRPTSWLFYVMPYVEGESLRQRLERDRQLPLDEALRITAEVAEALDYAHRQGIIHRDIKPENILLSRGHALVADFGIALAVAQAGGMRLTETGSSPGTPAYMSPEQALAGSDLDGRTDQYSLAAVLYEMLAGEPPYTGPTAQAIIAKRFREPVPHLSTSRDVPGAVEHAVTRALARAPVDRFPSIGEFARALQRATTPLTKNRRQLSWSVWVALSAALLTGLGGLILRYRGAATGLDPKRIVVAPFENRTGDPALDQVGLMVAEWITQGLSSTPLVEVVDSRSLLASVRAVRQGTGSADPIGELAQETRAGTVVSGSVYRLGDSLRVQAQVSDAATGRLRLTVDPVTVGVSEPAAVLEPLRQRLTGALASLLDDRLNNQGATTSRPPTYAAYQEYILGMENYSTDLHQDIGHFQSAARLDTSFTQALLWLGIAYADSQEFRLADSVFQIVERKRATLAPYDQANLDYFSRGFVHGDWEGSCRCAHRMLDLAPTAAHAKWAVGLSAAFFNRPGEALQVLERIDTARGWGRTWRAGIVNLSTDARHALGQYDRELAVATRPSDARFVTWIRSRRFRALVGLGRLSEALTVLPEDSDGGLLLECAHELAAHGYRDQGQVMARRAVDWYRERLKQGPEKRRWLAGLTNALLDAREWEEAHSAAIELLKLDPDGLTSRGLLGLSAAHAGDRAAADRILGDLERWSSPYTFGEPSWWRARVLGALGGSEAAIQALEDAFRNGYGRGTGLQFRHLAQSEFDVVRSDPRIRALLEPAG